MEPGTYNFTIFQGSTFDRTFTISDTTVDFEDYNDVRMMIRLRPGSDVIWSSETGDAGTITIADSTNLDLYIPAEVTAEFDFQEAGYDIELMAANGTVDKLLRGRIILQKEYTE